MGQMRQLRRLKQLIEAGCYTPEPAHVAEAMLDRRAVRELLIGRGSPLSSAGRTQAAQEARRQAA
jgi:hypothetical protein